MKESSSLIHNIYKIHLVCKTWRKVFFIIGHTGGKLWYTLNKNIVSRSRDKDYEQPGVIKHRHL